MHQHIHLQKENAVVVTHISFLHFQALYGLPEQSNNLAMFVFDKCFYTNLGV